MKKNKEEITEFLKGFDTDLISPFLTEVYYGFYVIKIGGKNYKSCTAYI